jgi:hypothetical protein
MSLWDSPEFAENKPTGGKFMKLTDFPTDAPLVLTLIERMEKVMTDDLKAKLEASGKMAAPEKYWVYYFQDMTNGTPVEREYTAFKPVTALTIALKGGKVKENGIDVFKPAIEKGDTFMVLRIGEGASTRFNITKLGKDVAVNEALIAKAKEGVTEPKTDGIPF